MCELSMLEADPRSDCVRMLRMLLRTGSTWRAHGCSIAATMLLSMKPGLAGGSDHLAIICSPAQLVAT